MKLLPPVPPLPPVSAGATLPPQNSEQKMERLPLPLPFSPTDLLWRYPFGLPSSPLMDFKTHLPTRLATDPRIWSREDVEMFLHYCEREFDLQPFEMNLFQMNGKAICLLTRNDLAQRCPGAGDVLHNVLQLLIRDATLLQRCLPSSPVTPTSRHPYPLSPHSHPPTPNWNILTQNTVDHFQTAANAVNLAHIMSQGNSVTLSPAPSVDSQQGSPQHADNSQMPMVVPKSEWTYNGNGSNQSDSDEDSYPEGSPQNGQHSGSPPNTPNNILAPPPLKSPKKETKEVKPQITFRPAERQFFPSDMPEPNTNGRLLWDFLQQLLNDPSQRYNNYIAWKNRDTGVFKIVDPAGLARLWGIQKNHLSMNYDKMSRALRYYYRVNILRKVQGERHCYQFLRNPTELKNIKNISLLRQQMSPTSPSANQLPHGTLSVKREHMLKAEQIMLKTEPVMPKPESVNQHTHLSWVIKPKQDHENAHNNVEDEEMPTDLSMSHHTDRSSKSDKHQISILCAPDINNYREQMSVVSNQFIENGDQMSMVSNQYTIENGEQMPMVSNQFSTIENGEQIPFSGIENGDKKVNDKMQ